MNIVMTGGGTGGHLAIIRAVKEQLHGRDLSQTDLRGSGELELVYIGSTRGQDQKWFGEDEDFVARYFLETKGVVDQRGLGKLSSLWMLSKAFGQARKLLKKHQADVVFSVGGFSSAATALAAKSLGIPLVIHEQNAALGSLNKLLQPFATEFVSSYLPQSPIHAYPIKEVFFDQARVREGVESIIFLGGSQGARAINKLALQMAPALAERGIRIIHQAGERHIDQIQSAYTKQGIKAEVFGFTDQLAQYMHQADFAVARAGASTLWELAANALPTLFVPYPYAASDHQYHNAQYLVDKNLAWVVREDQIENTKILELLATDMSPISLGLIETFARVGARQIAQLLIKVTQ